MGKGISLESLVSESKPDAAPCPRCGAEASIPKNPIAKVYVLRCKNGHKFSYHIKKEGDA